jgi:hypothetical protein
MNDELGPLPEPDYPAGGVGTLGQNCFTADQMREYATAAVLAERAACAKVCEENWQHVTAAAIRARTD